MYACLSPRPPLEGYFIYKAMENCKIFHRGISLSLFCSSPSKLPLNMINASNRNVLTKRAVHPRQRCTTASNYALFAVFAVKRNIHLIFSRILLCFINVKRESCRFDFCYCRVKKSRIFENISNKINYNVVGVYSEIVFLKCSCN